jgi:hypothetical protein
MPTLDIRDGPEEERLNNGYSTINPRPFNPTTGETEPLKSPAMVIHQPSE